jgi:hypothetical protein
MLRRFVPLALLLALGTLAGCSAFRASVGVGLGLGGSVKVGPLAVNALGGAALSWGNCYGVVGSHVTGELGLPGLAGFDMVSGDDGVTRIRIPGLVPIALAPFFLGDTDEDHNFRALVLDKPGELSASIYAVFFAFHLGFDALGLVNDARTYIGLATGGDLPDPGDDVARPVTAVGDAHPDDGLGDIPYRVISLEEIADVDSGTALARAQARSRFAEVLDDATALVQVEDGPVARYVTPRLALAHFAGVSSEARDDLASRHRRDAGPALERALAAHDPRAIAAALESYPFVEGQPEASLARARLLLERGELEESVSAYEDALRNMEERDQGRDGALAELAVAGSLLAAAGPAPAHGASATGVAEIEGYRIGLQGRSAWALTASGDVAWERSDALGQDLFASRVVGAEAGLAIVEAIKAERAWLLGLDTAGNIRWSLPLPGVSPGCSPVDQVYALGSGRVFVGRTDRALAVDAASGRVLWMSLRTGPTQPKHEADVKGLDWTAPPGPERRRPDGVHGFRIELTDRALELTSGTGRRVERLDPRTGDLLP